MTGHSLAVEGGFRDRSAQGLARFVAKLTDEERAIVERESGLKHARMIGAAACSAALAGKALYERLGPGETGVICTGGPWALAACSAFITRVSEVGPGLANPLQFPGTLVSATATAPASMLHAHAFAYVVGHDRLAFFEALHRASLSVQYGFAEQVLVLAVSSSDSFVEAARQRAGVSRPSLDAAIAVGVGAEGSEAKLKLLGVYVDSRCPAHGGESYEAEWCGDSFSCCIDTPLATGEAYGASGAVLCIAAAQHHAASAHDPTAAFSVSAHLDGRAATAVFQLPSRRAS
jgi:hypothetical protein